MSGPNKAFPAIAAAVIVVVGFYAIGVTTRTETSTPTPLASKTTLKTTTQGPAIRELIDCVDGEPPCISGEEDGQWYLIVRLDDDSSINALPIENGIRFKLVGADGKQYYTFDATKFVDWDVLQ